MPSSRVTRLPGGMRGIIEGPENFSPYKNMEGAKTRQATVLSKMVELGYITEASANSASIQPLNLSTETPNKYKYVAPYFTIYVINQLIDKYGEYTVYNGAWLG